MADTQTFMDRKGWPAGPWDEEPDREQWTDATTGLDCLIRRGPAGALCGYVAIPPDHPYFGKSSGDCLDDNCPVDDDPGGWHYECTLDGHLNVHGGITYASPCDDDPDEGICHRTEDGDHAWWLGFDCSHFQDLMPGHIAAGFTSSAGHTYRDWLYVRDEVESLADQLKAVTTDA